MEYTEIKKKIFSYTKKMGYEFEIVSSTHLKEIERELDLRKKTNEFNEDFYEERLKSFRYNPAKENPECKSIVIFAVPQPKALIFFRLNGMDYSVYIPPTYDISVDNLIEQDLNNIFQYQNIYFEKAMVPLKLLAVRCSLSDYGRNNICYLPGKGSFFRLIAYLSNVKCGDENWREVQFMERCKTCKACIKSCPTKAIDENRFLLHAELCITFHNEHSGNFPDFIDPSFHHCLFGCLKCQNVCPENRYRTNWIEEKEWFSEYETSFILNNKSLIEMPISTRSKLERLNIIDDYPYLSRNLKYCLDQNI